MAESRLEDDGCSWEKIELNKENSVEDRRCGSCSDDIGLIADRSKLMARSISGIWVNNCWSAVARFDESMVISGAFCESPRMCCLKRSRVWKHQRKLSSWEIKSGENWLTCGVKVVLVVVNDEDWFDVME